MMKCAESVKLLLNPYSHWTGAAQRETQRAEQRVSTTDGTMITLVHQLERENLSDITTYLIHQLERENWSTRAIQVYYLYIIVWESTTVSNSGLCT